MRDAAIRALSTPYGVRVQTYGIRSGTVVDEWNWGERHQWLPFSVSILMRAKNEMHYLPRTLDAIRQ